MSWIVRRQVIISRIVKTLKGLDGKEFDMTNFKEQICAEYGCSMRTAAEYIKIAQANFKQMRVVDE